mgnify:CR=1 FL=1
MLQFIKKEKIYILLLIFIVAVNIFALGQEKGEASTEEQSISTMSFEEIGITEDKVKGFFESGAKSAIFFKFASIIGFYIFIASIVLNIVFLFKRKKISLKPNLSNETVSWDVPDLIRATIVIVFAGYVIAIIESIVFRVFNFDHGQNMRMMISTFFVDTLALLVILYFVLIKCKATLKSLGIRVTSFFRNISTGIFAYVLILPGLLLILALSMWVVNLVGYTPPPQPIFDVLMKEEETRALFFLTIFISVFGPVVEEIFFRGFMYTAIKKHLGMVGAAFLSACIFSLLHTNVIGFLPIMALGVALAYLYERTGSLVASMAVHITHNSVILIFVFFVKGLIG